MGSAWWAGRAVRCSSGPALAAAVAGGGPDQRPSTVAELYRLMIEGDWAAAAAEPGQRGRTLRIEALTAGDEAAGAEASGSSGGARRQPRRRAARAALRKRGFSHSAAGDRPHHLPSPLV